jgi:ABC-type amino acid transport substrate-binding protein
VGLYSHGRKIVIGRTAAILVLCALAPLAMARAEPVLSVCLDENLPPDSFHHGEKSGGFDLAVSQALAKHLGQPLTVQWYESKVDLDSSSVLAADALLSDGRCQVVAGYPLVREALGKPGAPNSRLPDYEGAKPADRRRWVDLGTLMPSRPYHQAPLAIVVGAQAHPAARLADLQDLKLATESGTLSDAILMNFADGRLVDHVTHLVPGRNQLLPQLESGDFDATLVPLRRFDLYRAEHPDTKLRVAGYYGRITFNMGFVALSTEAALLERVNAALGEMLAAGELPALAEGAGMTYVPPGKPDVLEHISLRDLGGD